MAVIDKQRRTDITISHLLAIQVIILYTHVFWLGAGQHLRAPTRSIISTCKSSRRRHLVDLCDVTPEIHSQSLQQANNKCDSCGDWSTTAERWMDRFTSVLSPVYSMHCVEEDPEIQISDFFLISSSLVGGK